MDYASKLEGITKSITGFFTRKKAAPDGPPKIHSPRYLGQTQFEFQIQLRKGRPYELQGCHELKNWTGISKGAAPSDQFEFVDSEAGKTNARFYRVISNEQISNVLGFVSMTLCPGFCMISNPFNAADKRVSKLFPNLPEGTTFNKFDTSLFRLSKNGIENTRWLNPEETLSPGEGALISNPTSDFRPVHLAGEVLQGELSLPIPPGFSIRSAQLPLAGSLDADLGLPIAEGDVVHLFDRDRQKYIIYTFEKGRWSPAPPVISAGESFWIGKTAAGNWTQSFLNQ